MLTLVTVAGLAAASPAFAQDRDRTWREAAQATDTRTVTTETGSTTSDADSPQARALTIDDVLLPDIVPNRATGLRVYQSTTTKPGFPAYRLSFDGYVHNQGLGVLEIFATGPSGDPPTMAQVYQRLYPGGAPGATFLDMESPAVVKYEPSDGHNHFHFKNAVEYSLVGVNGTAMPANGTGLTFGKTQAGFCLGDTFRVNSWAPPRAYFTIQFPTPAWCGRNNRTAPSIRMGVQAGRRDLYDYPLPYQNVDLSQVLPGQYSLISRVDPDQVIMESDETNNDGSIAQGVSFTVTGHNAKPKSVTTPRNRTVSISVPVQSFRSFTSGSPSLTTARIQVVKPPAHGSVSTGRTTSVSYRPQTGFVGTDTFDVVARNGTSKYPLNPVVATITVTVT